MELPLIPPGVHFTGNAGSQTQDLIQAWLGHIPSLWSLLVPFCLFLTPQLDPSGSSPASSPLSTQHSTFKIPLLLSTTHCLGLSPNDCTALGLGLNHPGHLCAASASMPRPQEDRDSRFLQAGPHRTPSPSHGYFCCLPQPFLTATDGGGGCSSPHRAPYRQGWCSLMPRDPG